MLDTVHRSIDRVRVHQVRLNQRQAFLLDDPIALLFDHPRGGHWMASIEQLTQHGAAERAGSAGH